jgi:hypothetical protein
MHQTQIDKLAERLSALRNATVGRGPRHPTLPNEQLGAALADVLAAHRFLAHTHPDYVQFLDRYEGAAINDPEEERDYRVLIIYGIGAYHEGFSDPVDPGTRFYIFAENLVRLSPQTSVDLTFGFNAEDPSDGAVYVVSSLIRSGSSTTSDVFEPFAASFSDWLETVVQKDGRLAGAGDTPSG